MSAASPPRPAHRGGPLDEPSVLALFEQAGALRRGHFRLSSGRHSDTYLQCALVLQWPEVARALGAALAAPWRGAVDVVVGPAMGGIVIGHEVAAALGVRMLFAERAPVAAGEARELVLRRGFAVEAGERALVVEDVVTTGGSAMEAAALAERAGATVAGIGAIVDRTPRGAEPPAGLRALLTLDAPAWAPQDCPACAEGLPVDTPGSRRLDRHGR